MTGPRTKRPTKPAPAAPFSILGEGTRVDRDTGRRDTVFVVANTVPHHTRENWVRLGTDTEPVHVVHVREA